MKTYSLPFGKGEQQISLDETHILYDLHGNHVKAVSDEAAAVRKALRQPIDSLPLADVVAPGDTVAIIVSDITRPVHTAQMLPVIVNELNLAGIPDEQIKVVTAQGTHRAHTPEEDELVCGKEMVRGLSIINLPLHTHLHQLCKGIGLYIQIFSRIRVGFMLLQSQR